MIHLSHGLFVLFIVDQIKENITMNFVGFRRRERVVMLFFLKDLLSYLHFEFFELSLQDQLMSFHIQCWGRDCTCKRRRDSDESPSSLCCCLRAAAYLV